MMFNVGALQRAVLFCSEVTPKRREVPLLQGVTTATFEKPP